MPVYVTTIAPAGRTLDATVERLSDGYFWNPTAAAFQSAPTFANKKIAMTEGSAENIGAYTVSIAGLGNPGVCRIRVHDEGQANKAIGGGSPVYVWGGNEYAQADVELVVGTQQTAGDIVTLIGGQGTGARTLTVTVNDGAASLQNARIRLTLGAATIVQSTNASGRATFNLDDGTWTVAITKIGYTFAGTTKVVSASGSQTYSMTALTLTPSSPGLTTAYLTCYDETGAVLVGATVYCRLVSIPNTVTGLAGSTVSTSAVSDSNGVAQFTNRIKGAKYKFSLGESSIAFEETIPLTVGSTYVLPSITGTP